MPLELLAIAALVVACTYLVFGLTGFGSTVVSLPLLVHLLPLKFVLPLLLLLDLAAGLMVSSRGWRGVRWDELRWFVPFVLVGIALGLTLLVTLPEGPLLGALGVFVLAYGVYGLLRRAGPPKLSRAWGPPFGTLAGAFATLFGAGGVLTAIYVGARVADKGELRATTATAIFLSTTVRVVAFGIAGLLTQPGLLVSALALLPFAAGGVLLGHRLHAAVPAQTVVRALFFILVLAGISLLARVAR